MKNLMWLNMFGILLAGIAATARGEVPSKLVTRPLPIGLDQQETAPSGFYITLTEHEYHQPASAALAGATPGSAEAALRELWNAIQKKDAEGLKRVTVPDEQSNAGDNLSLYTELFQGTNDPLIHLRFDLGGADFVVADVQKQDIPGVAFVLIKGADGWRNSFNMLMHPLCQEMSLLCQEMKSDSKRYAAIVLSANARTVPLPPVAGTDMTASTKVSFIGYPIDFDVFATPTAKTSERPASCPPDAWSALQSYAAAWSDLKEGKLEEHASHFGPESREKVRKWIKSDPHGVDTFRQMMAQSHRRVVFIVNEGPVYHFIYQGPGQAGKPSLLNFDTGVKKDQGLMLVNAGSETELSGLLKTPEIAKAVMTEVLQRSDGSGAEHH